MLNDINRENKESGTNFILFYIQLIFYGKDILWETSVFRPTDKKQPFPTN